MSAERDLWCAVIQTAWDDAFHEGECAERCNNRQSARAWFGSRDFFEVCTLAGVNPHAVRDRYHAAMRGAA